MNLQITGKRIEISEVLRSQVEDKLGALCKKYSLTPIECTVTFTKDGPIIRDGGPTIRCAIEMHLGHGVYVRVYEELTEAYLSFEQTLETLEKRLRRHKKRLIDHERKHDLHYEKMSALQYVINPEEEREEEGDYPLVIAEAKAEIPTLTVGEAVMHLDLSDSPVMFFNNVAHNQFNVVYRRADGNIGWITPTQDKHA